ncbi:MAG TPA: hypothetical protein VGR62_11070 [Candidatus Binatia bacterium]|jgi:hypothetical protein|nr:hypothetical protein [Candidatus Binatia bacterium]
MRHRLLGVIGLVATLVACGHPSPGVPRPPARRIPAAGNNWPLAPARAERLFAGAPMELVSAEHTAQGVAGAYKAVVEFPPDPRPVKVKWKLVPPDDMDGWNNNPRKEIAAYAIQKIFLKPHDYVVPTTTLRCVPVAAYRHIDPKATPTIEGTTCVLGMLSLWLDNVTVPEVLYDPERFAHDDAYAYHLSNFNVLSFLIRHRDGRPGNILVADRDDNRRVFAIDNGISFDGLVYNFLVSNWDSIRVPAVRRSVVAELRDEVDDDDLDELGTLVEMRADKQGVLKVVKPTAPIDPDKGIRIVPGRLQMGLTRSEIAGLRARMAELLLQVDQGTIGTF